MALTHNTILGELTITAGTGAPTHEAPAGSLYVDVATGYLYARKQVDAATTTWVSISATTAAVPTNLVVAGTVTLSALPTSDPAVAGQLYASSGTVKVSAGA